MIDERIDGTTIRLKARGRGYEWAGWWGVGVSREYSRRGVVRLSQGDDREAMDRAGLEVGEHRRLRGWEGWLTHQWTKGCVKCARTFNCSPIWVREGLESEDEIEFWLVYNRVVERVSADLLETCIRILMTCFVPFPSTPQRGT